MVFTQLVRMSIRLFEEAAHTQRYQLYRPSYPLDLVNYIVTYTKEKRPALEAALDIGCGSGQGTALFAQHFQRVTGVDVSAQQIMRASEAYAGKLPNTSFMVSEAENLPMSSGSVDLITCAQSFHWFNEKRFCEEAKRVLCTDGTLAVFGYYLPIYEDEGVNEAMFEIYEGLLGRYWSSRRRLIENRYEDVSIPFTDVRRETFVTRESGSLSSLANLISSWSAYEAYRKEHPDSLSLADIKQRLMEGANSGKDAETTSLNCRREYFLVIGRKE